MLQSRLEEALDDTPVVLIHGPRQCGKTTLAQQIGKKSDYAYYTFDDANLLAAAKADPIGFVDRLPPKTILDEVQHVPELFSSIKHAVDRDRTPGRFLLTGSANVLLLPKLSDSLAGRMEIVQLRPLSRCEIEKTGKGLLTGLFQQKWGVRPQNKLGDRIADLIVTGGFPEPVQRTTERRRSQWHQNYIETLVQRDIRDLARISSLEAIPKILQLAAAQSAQLLNMSEIAAPLQISRPTVASYFALLQNIFLLDELPAWHRNKVKRLVKTPKLHLSDTGLASSLLGATAAQLRKDRDVLGHLLESFVYNELRRQASWSSEDIRFFHYRDKDQYEVDIVMEQGGGNIVAVEVKAAATVSEKDFKGLRRLQSLAGNSWKIGVVFFDGEIPLQFGEDLYAMPISALWGQEV